MSVNLNKEAQAVVDVNPELIGAITDLTEQTSTQAYENGQNIRVSIEIGEAIIEVSVDRAGFNPPEPWRNEIISKVYWATFWLIVVGGFVLAVRFT